MDMLSGEMVVFENLLRIVGAMIKERIMTTLATRGQKGLDSLQMLTAKLAS
jgi:hypothetical protein